MESTTIRAASGVTPSARSFVTCCTASPGVGVTVGAGGVVSGLRNGSTVVSVAIVVGVSDDVVVMFWVSVAVALVGIGATLVLVW